jgi:hypothetical protein
MWTLCQNGSFQVKTPDGICSVVTQRREICQVNEVLDKIYLAGANFSSDF